MIVIVSIVADVAGILYFLLFHKSIPRRTHESVLADVQKHIELLKAEVQKLQREKDSCKRNQWGRRYHRRVRGPLDNSCTIYVGISTDNGGVPVTKSRGLHDDTMPSTPSQAQFVVGDDESSDDEPGHEPQALATRGLDKNTQVPTSGEEPSRARSPNRTASGFGPSPPSSPLGRARTIDGAAVVPLGTAIPGLARTSTSASDPGASGTR